jgi:hypothetical protein
MLAEDVYHPHRWADYTVREFKAAKVSPQLVALQAQ